MSLQMHWKRMNMGAVTEDSKQKMCIMTAVTRRMSECYHVVSRSLAIMGRTCARARSSATARVRPGRT